MDFPEPHSKEGVKSGLEFTSLKPGAPASVVRELELGKVLSKTWAALCFYQVLPGCFQETQLGSSKSGDGEFREVRRTPIVSPGTTSLPAHSSRFV